MKRKKAKIICTLGPASSKASVISKMVENGMSIARLNFSHGTHQTHKISIDIIRTQNNRNRDSVKILQDLEGYRIRIGNLKNPVQLKKGHYIYLTQGRERSRGYIPFDYEGDVKEIKKGTSVFIDDGNIMLRVIGHRKNSIKVEVIFGGLLKQRKGINIPSLRIKTDVFTQKDRNDIEFGMRNYVDYIAQSFVRNKKDIRLVADLVKPHLPKCKIIAKIENREGLKNIDSIMSACDGIMIARGDLGVSIPIYKIPMIQKDIIRRCNAKKKIVITATQMLESMSEHNRPTRAEVADVANAVLDGTDFVMLSGETASGRFPILSVKMMSQIVKFTEDAKRRVSDYHYCKFAA